MRNLSAPRIELDWAHEKLVDFHAATGIALQKHTRGMSIDFKQEQNVDKPPGLIDSRQWDVLTAYIVGADPIQPEIGIRLGEVIHNYRSFLDRLVWRLVPNATKRAIKASGRRKIEFPMAPNYARFESRIGETLPDVSPEIRKVIERFQPYHHSVRGRAMRLLGNMSNINKHRTIVPPVVMPYTNQIDFDLTGGVFIAREYLIDDRTELKSGTEVARLTVAIQDSPYKVHHQVQGSNVLSLPTNLIKPFAGETVIFLDDALKEISVQCESLLAEVWNTA